MTTQTPVPGKVEIKKEPELKAPENETTLATQTLPQGETVLKIQGDHNTLLYGILQRNRAETEQSDFYRVQFRGYAVNINHVWTLIKDDDAHYNTGRNCAWVRVDHPSRSMIFGPKAGITVSDRFRGPGLADFLFAAAVNWARSTYPEYSASDSIVMMPAASTLDEKLHRQSFYAKQGFDFEWADAAKNSGLFRKEAVGRLIGISDTLTIAEFGGDSMLQSLIKQDEERQALELRMEKIQSMNNAIHLTLDKERHTTQVLTIILLLMLVITLWAVL